MTSIQRILLIRPSALGDVCRSVPVLASLRRAHPDATIDWLVQDAFAGAVRHHPDLSGVVPFPRKQLGQAGRRGRVLPAIRWMNEHLRGRYDLVIDAQGLFRSALFAWWTRAPRRVGFADARELGGVFYSDRVRVGRELHAVDRMLALVEGAGIEPVADMRLHTDPQALSDVITEHPERFVVLAPTSRWAAKRWPIDRFVRLCEMLLGDGAARVVLVGGPGEREQCGPLVELARREPRVVDRIGSTSIDQLMALIARARLVVANDSAALHMAVGFDRPLVALFGPTRVGLVGPYRRDGDVIQHITQSDRLVHKDPAAVDLMARITVDEVAAACRERLVPGYIA